MKTYEPKPIDTGKIELSDELLTLTERIAENVHDVWAANRIAEGWTYGKKRSDELKQNPCLVPYGKLPESEKEYDRATVIATLKSIKKFGFDIVKKQDC